MEDNFCEIFGVPFDGKTVYIKRDDNLIPLFHCYDEVFDKLIREWANKKWDGYADCIICQNGEVIETVGEYCERNGIEIK